MNRYNRRTLLTSTSVLAAGLAASGPGILEAARHHPRDRARGPKAARRLVVITIDGCRADYRDLVAMPHLEALERSGTTYERAWTGELANNTPPGHTSLSTGVFPGKHGVVNFYWRDPRTSALVRLTDEKAVRAGQLNALIRAANVPSMGQDFKRLHPGARVAAIGGGKYHAVAGLGSNIADYIVYGTNGEGTAPENEPERRVEERAGAGPVIRPAAVRGFEPPPGILGDRSLVMHRKSQADGDTFAMNLALRMFAIARPEVLLLNLPETDQAGHATGGVTNPGYMAKMLTNVDTQIGRLVEAYREAGLFEETLWVVTADHGMTPNSHRIDRAALAAGLRRAAATTVGGIGSYTWLAGGRGVDALAREWGAAGVAGLHAVLVKVGSGRDSYYTVAGEAGGNLAPGVLAAYEYLFNTVAGSNGPDIGVAYAENWHFAEDPPDTHGSHSEVTWLEQHVPLVIAGPGVARGRVSRHPARLVDVAPTVRRLLGLPASYTSGVALADAFESPRGPEVVRHRENARRLSPLAAALAEQSERDLAGGGRPRRRTVHASV